MTLEDHLGDIIRKARTAANVSPNSAAQAAGINTAELAELEENGKSSRTPNLKALAPLIGLNPAKLERIASGWLPKETDLSNWREVRQITTTARLSVNCYLVWDEVTREAALFDTGWDPAPALKLVEENQLKLNHLFITHSHPDHVAGLAKVRDRFPKIFMHSDMAGSPPQQRNRRNDCIHLGSLRITNRDTPGHAEDGVTYIVGNWPDDAPHVAIVGDAIFAGSMGGAPQHGDLARQKVSEQILSLPAGTLLCPGHGPLTTVAEEKANNPFFG